MRNPLMKRLPRELKAELGKYLVIFLFLIGSIGIVSGYLVAGDSMKIANDEAKDKYKVEDGNFELYFEASDELIDQIEKDGNAKIYKNYFINAKNSDESATYRVYKNRTEVDLVDVLEGQIPSKDDEIAISRTFASNSKNNLSIGDKVTINGVEYKISGFVSMSDYLTQFENATDMMFDSERFSASIVTKEGFDRLDDSDIHYNYSFIYDVKTKDDNDAADKSEAFLDVVNEKATANMNAITNYIPAYANQAIIFAPNDISGDKTGVEILGYLIIILVAFIFGITINTTVTKEAQVIGTLRASGYKRSEIILHYMICPMLVVTLASIIGNILGYTVFKDFAADLYYKSYDLPKFEVIWNTTAFIKTTVIPFIICFLINFLTLYRKLKLSPLRFLRKDISSTARRKAPRLSYKMGIMRRFRIRIILQNFANYITIFIGIFLAMIFVVFGMVMEPLMDNYAKSVSDNMLADYQYVLKVPSETKTDGAEKVTMSSFKTVIKGEKEEEVSFYGISADSKYLKTDFEELKENEIYISTGLAEKYKISVGDEVTFKECYASDKYTYKVAGLYEYPSICSAFMSREVLNDILDQDKDYFNGYLSNKEIDDIEELYIASKITVDDMTKVSRQLTNSMGGLMKMVTVFGVITYMLVIYLLSKIIIEKNSNAISMNKILGYYDGEINNLYVLSTTIVVMISFILTVPLTNIAIKYLWGYMMKSYSGWFPYDTPYMSLVEIFIIGIISYAAIAFLLLKQVKKTPMLNALKAVE